MTQIQRLNPKKKKRTIYKEPVQSKYTKKWFGRGLY